MKKHELVYAVDEIDFAAREIRELMPFCSVITLSGSLGAGKTTLVQSLLRQCGVAEMVQSPTFLYFTEYANGEGNLFYHFDLYRLQNAREFVDNGFAEYLYVPNSWALIEWPEIIMPFVQKRACHIALEYISEEKRLLRYVVTDE